MSVGSLTAAIVIGLSSAAAAPAHYVYGGMQSSAAVVAVAATITPIDLAHVRSGHAAAWVGVGGPGLGPGGADEWLQVGVTGFPGQSTATVYLESKRGDHYAFAALADGVAVGEGHRLAVLEIAARPGWWRASLDGKPVGRPLFLPGSHGRWPGQVVAEDWLMDGHACNGFAFRFTDVAVRTAGARSLRRLTSAVTIAQGRVAVVESRTGFTARCRCP